MVHFFQFNDFFLNFAFENSSFNFWILRILGSLNRFWIAKFWITKFKLSLFILFFQILRRIEIYIKIRFFSNSVPIWNFKFRRTFFKFDFSEAFKFVDIPFTNKYEWNTMVDYSPADRMIYAWDRGHQVTYNLTITTTGSWHRKLTRRGCPYG